jgi:hypothetical protein
VSAPLARVEHPSQLRRPPRYATLPDLSLRTRGHKIAVLAREMGKPMLPHQRYIADVATEMNPPGHPFLFRRRLVVVSLPRQTGKTTLQRPVFVERCMARPQAKAFMTAQMGKYSSERWNDLVSDLEASPVFRSWTRIVRGKGSERCHFPNGSFISPFAPGPEALHGETPPIVSVDEGWAFSAEEGAALLKAIRPAQQTLWDRQLWIFSAAGDASSEWWNALQEQGRASVNDPLSDMAYFEWSIADGADPYDEDAWQFHPGLDGLISIDTLREESNPERNPHADWLRGFMNRATVTRDVVVIDLDLWDTLTGPQQPPSPREVAYGYDVAIDRTAASVWTAWRAPDGKLDLHVHKSAEGADWLAEHVGAIHREHPGASIAADDGGPARVVTDALVRAGVPVRTLVGRDASTAWTSFKAEVAGRRVRHEGSALLRRSLEVAAERSIGDATALSRRLSLGAIDPLVAAQAAAWFADRAPGPQLFV